MKKMTVDELLEKLNKFHKAGDGSMEIVWEVLWRDNQDYHRMAISNVVEKYGKCVITLKEEEEIERDSYPEYPSFTIGEYDEKVCQYSGYVIEASYDEDNNEWCVDVFDREEGQYVLSPLERGTDFDEVIGNVITRINHKRDIDCSDDILIN